MVTHSRGVHPLVAVHPLSLRIRQGADLGEWLLVYVLLYLSFAVHADDVQIWEVPSFLVRWPIGIFLGDETNGSCLALVNSLQKAESLVAHVA